MYIRHFDVVPQFSVALFIFLKSFLSLIISVDLSSSLLTCIYTALKLIESVLNFRYCIFQFQNFHVFKNDSLFLC